MLLQGLNGLVLGIYSVAGQRPIRCDKESRYCLGENSLVDPSSPPPSQIVSGGVDKAQLDSRLGSSNSSLGQIR